MYRVTISVTRESGDAHDVFKWVTENIRNKSWFITTDWITIDQIITRIVIRCELPLDQPREVYTDIKTRERIMTFEFEDDLDASIMRLRFNEVSLDRDVNIMKVEKMKKILGQALGEI